jgi:small subunit ribosomal protein S8
MAVISDPIGDTLTRIRNGQRSNKMIVQVSFSKIISNLLHVLKKEGYIRFFETKELRKGIYIIQVELKYFDSKPVIYKIQRISKPGRRVYSKVSDLNLICNGLGISILSTPKGILSDYDARKSNVGGEVMCKVL